MKRIIKYFVENYNFTTYQVGSNVHTLIKDDIHIFLYVESKKIIFNNIVFENIETVKDLKFIYFKCKGIKIDESIDFSTNNFFVERDENDINILKLEKIQ
jgi:hypothetical protein